MFDYSYHWSSLKEASRGDDGRQGVFDLLSEFEAETSVKKREELIPGIAGELKALYEIPADKAPSNPHPKSFACAGLYEIPADKAPSNRLLEKIACDFGVKEVLKAGIVQEGACLLGKGEFYILYSAESKTMKNYVLAHELGHYLLSHCGKSIHEAITEREADQFAYAVCNFSADRIESAVWWNTFLTVLKSPAHLVRRKSEIRRLKDKDIYAGLKESADEFYTFCGICAGAYPLAVVAGLLAYILSQSAYPGDCNTNLLKPQNTRTQ